MVNFFKKILGITRLERVIADKDSAVKTLERNMLMINNMVNVGVDIHPESNSWMVLSLRGKKRDYVEFFALSDMDMSEISSFLSQFRNKNIDTPLQLSKDFFI